MTQLNIAFAVPEADGTPAPASGLLRFTPTRRRVEDGVTILPASFSEPLTLGAATVTLEPTTSAWLWRIDEHLTGVPARTIYAAIPDQATLLYTELVAVDPATMTPEPGTAPAWSVPLAELDTRLSAGVISPDPAYPGLYLIGG